MVYNSALINPLKLGTIYTNMPHEPKRRHSRERKGERRFALKLSVKKTVKCPNCGEITLPHMVCKYCGFYKGKEVIKTKKTASK